ncbi:MAG: methyltransferase domain-containing protein [Actinomycetota bacterium]
MSPDQQAAGGAFRAVDQQEDPAFFFKLLDLQAANPGIVSLRETTRTMIAAKPGMKILDVGSGTGEVARTLAGDVAPSGSVLGVDLSEQMLNEARRRTQGTGLPVSFEQANVEKLDLDSESFDAVHSERTLQHVPDVEAAFSEMLRVLKPGGRLVIADTDWDTLIMDADDLPLARKVFRHIADGFTSAAIGRRLYGLFLEAGLQNVMIEPSSLLWRGHDADFFVQFPKRGVNDAFENNVINEKERDRMLQELDRRTNDGTLFMSVTMFAVSGTK